MINLTYILALDITKLVILRDNFSYFLKKLAVNLYLLGKRTSTLALLIQYG
jgi:hypothetical protein